MVMKNSLRDWAEETAVLDVLDYVTDNIKYAYAFNRAWVTKYGSGTNLTDAQIKEMAIDVIENRITQDGDSEQEDRPFPWEVSPEQVTVTLTKERAKALLVDLIQLNKLEGDEEQNADLILLLKQSIYTKEKDSPH
jgi:hypothetical protein